MSQECGCVFIEIYREFTQNKIKNLIAFKDTVDAKEKRIKNKKQMLMLQMVFYITIN